VKYYYNLVYFYSYSPPGLNKPRRAFIFTQW